MPLWHETGSAAGVVELVDALDSKSSSERSAGSTPAARTTSVSAFGSEPAQAAGLHHR